MRSYRKSHKATGEGHYAARLSWSDVRMIRHRDGCPACRETSARKTLAAEYGISAVMVHFIVTGKKWHPAHDPNPSEVGCPLDLEEAA